MIIVLAYVEGEIRFGGTGADYSIPPKITFLASEMTTLEEVKNEIYREFGYVGGQYTMSIQARFDTGAPEPHYFQLIPIHEKRGWRMIFEKTQSRTTWQVIELYVNMAPS